MPRQTSAGPASLGRCPPSPPASLSVSATTNKQTNKRVYKKTPERECLLNQRLNDMRAAVLSEGFLLNMQMYL